MIILPSCHIVVSHDTNIYNIKGVSNSEQIGILLTYHAYFQSMHRRVRRKANHRTALSYSPPKSIARRSAPFPMWVVSEYIEYTRTFSKCGNTCPICSTLELNRGARPSIEIPPLFASHRWADLPRSEVLNAIGLRTNEKLAQENTTRSPK